MTEEEKQFQIDHAHFAAKLALSWTQLRKGNSGRGGRGCWGGRGGREGWQHKEGGWDKTRDAPGPIVLSESQMGGKRKCDTEPDGGPDVGVHGAGVPTIAPAKKVKADES